MNILGASLRVNSYVCFFVCFPLLPTLYSWSVEDGIVWLHFFVTFYFSCTSNTAWLSAYGTVSCKVAETHGTEFLLWLWLFVCVRDTQSLTIHLPMMHGCTCSSYGWILTDKNRMLIVAFDIFVLFWVHLLAGSSDYMYVGIKRNVLVSGSTTTSNDRRSSWMSDLLFSPSPFAKWLSRSALAHWQADEASAVL